MSLVPKCADSPRRSEYTAPTLTAFGNLAELTRHGPAKNHLDGSTPTSKTNS